MQLVTGRVGFRCWYTHPNLGALSIRITLGNKQLEMLSQQTRTRRENITPYSKECQWRLFQGSLIQRAVSPRTPLCMCSVSARSLTLLFWGTEELLEFKSQTWQHLQETGHFLRFCLNSWKRKLSWQMYCHIWLPRKLYNTLSPNQWLAKAMGLLSLFSRVCGHMGNNGSTAMKSEFS